MSEEKIEEVKELTTENKIKEQNKKIKEVVKLFEKIRKLMPHNSIAMSLHKIDVKNLDDDIWEVEANYLKGEKRVYLCANRKHCKDKSFDISLFN